MEKNISIKRVKQIISEEVEKINESGLNRVYYHIQNHNCAILTGFQKDTKDFSSCLINSDKTVNNKERNKNLRAFLLEKGYGVTSVKGTYVENYMTDNAVEVKENSYFVVNLNDSSSFFENIKNLGEYFCQDSVLIIPKEERNEQSEIISDKPYLLGTNNSWPGNGEKQELNYFKGGVESEFMTRVKGRPIVFEGKGEKIKLERYCDYSKMGRWSISICAKEVDKKVKER